MLHQSGGILATLDEMSRLEVEVSAANYVGSSTSLPLRASHAARSRQPGTNLSCTSIRKPCIVAAIGNNGTFP
ncbi:hypothetical protein CDEST_12144 [Colletotrichum destructivum]|uniref:Uncharacterized protein n=1 Tax=Colletotrichum destructivum TaxID=34406 RepID=A0AAX4IV50_9PEZI|nr:hypothetical protein CDEST_12144 [Colletotrichum destructivum]